MVWTVAGEARDDLPGRQAVASVVHNRLAAGAPDPVSVVSEPGQFKAYGSVADIAKRYPVGSPQYQQLESQIAPIITGAQPPTVPYTGFRTHGYTSPGTPWNGASPIATIGGNDFATVPYKYSGAPTPDVAASLGLTAEEQKALAPYTGAAPNTPAAGAPAAHPHVTFGPDFAHVSEAADATFAKIAKERGGIDTTLDQGDPRFPFYIPPGSVAPTTAGAHWVDVNGTEHINPGDAGARALNAAQGFAQGVGADTLASLNRLTGGGFAAGDPTYAALGQGLGGPGAGDLATAAKEGFAEQQRNYALAHHGDPYAQTGRFFGQAAPAVVASAMVPEIEAPAALGGVGRVAASATTNALRGVAATAPSVGANPAPVAQQLATGALSGVVAPAVTGAGAKVIGARDRPWARCLAGGGDAGRCGGEQVWHPASQRSGHGGER